MNKKKYLAVDLRTICIALIIIIVAMLLTWRPWEPVKAGRKITVEGQSMIKASPDEFQFSPYFEKTGKDVTALKKQLNQYGATFQKDLKKLGVKESDIVLDSSSYDYSYAHDNQNNDQTITLRAQVTVSSKKLAQKIQDYLAQTDAKGQLTADALFSDKKRKEIEDSARQKAVQDARKKADQTAKDLDATIGKVIEVDTQQSSPIAYTRSPMLSVNGAEDQSSSLPVTPGSQDITVIVRVAFALQ